MARPKGKKRRHIASMAIARRALANKKSLVCKIKRPKIQVRIRKAVVGRKCKGKPRMLPYTKPQGRRLWSMRAIEIAIRGVVGHAHCCQGANFSIVRERRVGMVSELTLKCSACRFMTVVRTDSNDCTLPCTEAAVWAGNTTGSGYTVMKHALAALDVPFVTQATYLKKETKFHHDICQVRDDVLIQNGIEEKALAMALGRVDPDGVVWTEVEGDGAWSKRSYNNRGTSLSGSAVLIGMLSKKVLFTGVRNKYCKICSMKRVGEIPPHTCYKNWNGSSSEMETDIIAEGFSKSIVHHALRYKRYLGDGDSSTFCRIENTYYDGVNDYTLVRKIECKNHALRRMNTSLRDLLTQTAYDKGDRRVLDDHINRIGKFCAYAVQAARENMPTTNASSLYAALSNALNHVAGVHDNCPAFICVDGVLLTPTKYNKSDYEILPNSEKNAVEFQTLRKSTTLWKELEKIMNRLVAISPSLIYSETTNISESYQGQFAKFINGKRKNVNQRGAYVLKSAETTLAHQYGAGWYSEAFKRSRNSDPVSPRSRNSDPVSPIWMRMQSLGIKSRIRKKKLVRRNIRGTNKKKPAYYSRVCALSDAHYGPNAERVDMDNVLLTQEVANLISAKAMVTAEQQWDLHLATIGQYENERYKSEKRHMITASKAGSIRALRDSTSNVCTLDSLLHSKFKGNSYTNWGTQHEHQAIALFMAQNFGVEVEKSGLFRSLEFGYLGASPDGLIKDGKGIVEVKCPFIERYKLPTDVTKRKTDAFLEKVVVFGDEFIQLKKTHAYYDQVVMQLHVTGREYCEFVVWTQGELDATGNPKAPEGFIHNLTIFKSRETQTHWEKMKQILIRFVKEDLLPEVVDSRIERIMGYRQPQYRLDAMEIIVESKVEKGTTAKERKKRGSVVNTNDDSPPVKKKRVAKK